MPFYLSNRKGNHVILPSMTLTHGACRTLNTGDPRATVTIKIPNENSGPPGQDSWKASCRGQTEAAERVVEFGVVEGKGVVSTLLSNPVSILK